MTDQDPNAALEEALGLLTTMRLPVDQLEEDPKQRIRSLFKQRIPIAEVREMMNDIYEQSFSPRPLPFPAKTAGFKLANAILKEHNWNP